MQTITEPAKDAAPMLPETVAGEATEPARDEARREVASDGITASEAVARANAYLEAGLVVEASEMFSDEVDRSGDAWARLGLARCAFLRRNLHEAVGILQSIRAEEAAYPEAVNDMGVILCELGLLAEARVHIEEAARLMPENPVPVRNLIDVTLASEDFAACRAHCADYLALVPADEEVRAIEAALSERLG